VMCSRACSACPRLPKTLPTCHFPHLSCALLPRCRRGGEPCKEGFWSVPVRQCLNKTMPLIHPVVATRLLPLVLPMPTEDREITPLTPSQGTSQSLPKARIEEGLFCRHNKRGRIICSRPGGEVAIGSLIRGVHAIRTVDVIRAYLRVRGQGQTE
jgi:hypothetical protein